MLGALLAAGFGVTWWGLVPPARADAAPTMGPCLNPQPRTFAKRVDIAHSPTRRLVTLTIAKHTPRRTPFAQPPHRPVRPKLVPVIDPVIVPVIVPVNVPVNDPVVQPLAPPVIDPVATPEPTPELTPVKLPVIDDNYPYRLPPTRSS